MPLAILGPFQLIKCLSQHSYARVYLAEGDQGRRFVVKFLMTADPFFEELARHYALDSCNQLCKLVVNYPSYAVCGDPFMFRKGLAALFGYDDFDGRHLDDEEMLVSPLADIGVLVFEYVEGQSLVSLMPQWESKEQLTRLFELAELLLSLHRLGECHGDLIAPNVLIEDGSNELKLLDLGYFPSKPLPDGQFRAPQQGRMIESLSEADDVYMLARNFLKLAAVEDVRFTTKVAQALEEDPRKRPSLEQIVAMLRAVIGLEEVVQDRSSRKWRSRYTLPLAAAAVLLLSVWLWEPNRFGLGFSGSEVSERVTLDQLSNLQRYQAGLAQAIPDATGAKVSTGSLEDLRRPYAVFAHEDSPVLVGCRSIYALGDPLIVDGAKGKILSITAKEVLIALPKEMRVFELEQTGYHPRVSGGETGWYVWQHAGNLPRLLEASAQLVGGWEERAKVDGDNNLSFLLRHHRNDLRITAETVYGYYPAMNARHFLVLMERQLNIKPKGQSFEVALRKGVPPLYRFFPHFMVENATVKSFSRYLGEMTGVEINCPPQLENQLLPRRLYTDIAWQDVLNALGFQWRYHESRRGGYVEILGMNQGPSS